MPYNYDQLYAETPNALGVPSPVFVKFFNDLDDRSARVLDVGCGQGRDAIFVARKGHKVVGVDLSRHGIRDLNLAAAQEGLAITAIVADLVQFVPDGPFDIVVVDRTLHMLPEADRLALLDRLLTCVASQGWVLIADERTNIPGFKTVIADHPRTWHPRVAKGGILFVQAAD